MAKNKVKIIFNWPTSHKIKNMQFFLGFANFYHCFILFYSDIVISLIWLIQKDAS